MNASMMHIPRRWAIDPARQPLAAVRAEPVAAGPFGKGKARVSRFRSHRSRLQQAAIYLCIVLASLAPLREASAGGFSALISPPRFELRAQPGQTLRQIVEVTNVSVAPAALAVQTAEWRYGNDGGLLFDNPLMEGSCRPWVALETRDLQLGAKARRRFRFEIKVPKDAPAQECRFALMFEGAPETVGALSVPVSGRIAVIVYVTVGTVEPRLEIETVGSIEIEGRRLPALTVRNSGNSTTRLEGFLSGRNPNGTDIVFVPQNFPVLPGQTRTLALYPEVSEGQTPPTVSFPIKLSGRLEWSGQQLKMDQVFTE